MKPDTIHTHSIIAIMYHENSLSSEDSVDETGACFYTSILTSSSADTSSSFLSSLILGGSDFLDFP